MEAEYEGEPSTTEDRRSMAMDDLSPKERRQVLGALSRNESENFEKFSQRWPKVARVGVV